MKRIIILVCIIMLIINMRGLLFSADKPKKERILSSNISFKNLKSNEKLCTGTVFEIEWEGVAPIAVVKIEYSTNGGTSWIFVTNSATGLKYQWTVPNTPSANCVARVSIEVDCIENWATTNLNVDHYRNGDSIPEVRDSLTWKNLTTGAWCYYNNNPSNGATYGKLYNWYAVNDPRGLAPSGWHVATDAEWTELVDCLDGSAVAGGKLKEAGTTHWQSPNTGATNESGFTALPGGGRGTTEGFIYLGYDARFWSSTVYTTYSWGMILWYNYSIAQRNGLSWKWGCSVRCVRD